MDLTINNALKVNNLLLGFCCDCEGAILLLAYVFVSRGCLGDYPPLLFIFYLDGQKPLKLNFGESEGYKVAMDVTLQKFFLSRGYFEDHTYDLMKHPPVFYWNGNGNRW